MTTQKLIASLATNLKGKLFHNVAENEQFNYVEGSVGELKNKTKKKNIFREKTNNSLDQ